MPSWKTPWYLTLLAVVVCVAAVLVLQPYSADWPGTDYAKPARRYVSAALRRDSAALVTLSASGRPVAWALRAARSRPDSLAAWGHRSHAYIGERAGDTAEVFLYPEGEVCGEAPIVFRFVGARGKAKVVQASSTCLDAR